MGIYKKMRLDRILVDRGLALTRSRAADLIRLGAVSVEGVTALKPGALLDPGASLVVDTEASPFVSRGGLKLAAALDAFRLDPNDLIALDIGASTGGFTEVLLERGAARVFSVDVGRDQLHATLREDPRVVALEGTDARRLDAGIVAGPVDAIVADVSFISLTKALPVALSLPRRAPGSLPWSSRNSRSAASWWAKAASFGMQRLGRGRWRGQGVHRRYPWLESVCRDALADCWRQRQRGSSDWRPPWSLRSGSSGLAPKATAWRKGLTGRSSCPSRFQANW